MVQAVATNQTILLVGGGGISAAAAADMHQVLFNDSRLVGHRFFV